MSPARTRRSIELGRVARANKDQLGRPGLPGGLSATKVADRGGTSVADRILVADDDKDIRSVLALYMEDAGFEVVEAANGGEALDVLEHQPVRPS